MTRINEALLASIIALLLVIIAAQLIPRATPPPSVVRDVPIVSVPAKEPVRPGAPASNPDRTSPPFVSRPETAGTTTSQAASPDHTRIAEPIIGGRATWYPASGMIGAAGPLLRSYVGKGWRGSLVEVCSGWRCVIVRLADWCLCSHGRRLVDLSDDAFRQLAPLSRGVIAVSIDRVVRVPDPPATDR